VEKNNFKRKNLKDIKEWFENFGIAVNEEDGYETYKFICWNEMNARPNLDNVVVSVKEIMDRLL
jgi:hypothetical protein